MPFHDGGQPCRSHFRHGGHAGDGAKGRVLTFGGLGARVHWSTCGGHRVPEVSGLPSKPGTPILPCVLECAVAPRHRLPYGKMDRPIYSTASRVRAKAICDLIPFDLPSNGL
jgi:hypothetical protein